MFGSSFVVAFPVRVIDALARKITDANGSLDLSLLGLHNRSIPPHGLVRYWLQAMTLMSYYVIIRVCK